MTVNQYFNTVNDRLTRGLLMLLPILTAWLALTVGPALAQAPPRPNQPAVQNEMSDGVDIPTDIPAYAPANSPAAVQSATPKDKTRPAAASQTANSFSSLEEARKAIWEAFVARHYQQVITLSTAFEGQYPNDPLAQLYKELAKDRLAELQKMRDGKLPASTLDLLSPDVYHSPFADSMTAATSTAGASAANQRSTAVAASPMGQSAKGVGPHRRAGARALVHFTAGPPTPAPEAPSFWKKLPFADKLTIPKLILVGAGVVLVLILLALLIVASLRRGAAPPEEEAGAEPPSDFPRERPATVFPAREAVSATAEAQPEQAENDIFAQADLHEPPASLTPNGTPSDVAAGGVDAPAVMPPSASTAEDPLDPHFDSLFMVEPGDETVLDKTLQAGFAEDSTQTAQASASASTIQPAAAAPRPEDDEIVFPLLMSTDESPEESPAPGKPKAQDPESSNPIHLDLENHAADTPSAPVGQPAPARDVFNIAPIRLESVELPSAAPAASPAEADTDALTFSFPRFDEDDGPVLKTSPETTKTEWPIDIPAMMDDETKPADTTIPPAPSNEFFQEFHPDETVPFHLSVDDDEADQTALAQHTQAAPPEENEAYDDLYQAETQTNGTETPKGKLPPSEAGRDDLFNDESRQGLEDLTASNWAGAVHHLSIATALRPDQQDIRDKLREARRRRKEEMERHR